MNALLFPLLVSGLAPGMSTSKNEQYLSLSSYGWARWFFRQFKCRMGGPVRESIVGWFCVYLSWSSLRLTGHCGLRHLNLNSYNTWRISWCSNVVVVNRLTVKEVTLFFLMITVVIVEAVVNLRWLKLKVWFFIYTVLRIPWT